MRNYVSKGNAVVSPELAYLLYSLDTSNKFNYSENLKIVSTEKLKGVWQGRGYPIIWFRKEWNPETMFEYDEHLENSFVSTVKSERHQPITNVENIFSKISRESKLDEMRDLIQNLPAHKQNNEVTYIPPDEKMAEIHCVAICITQDDRIMIAKRPLSKNTLPGKWEFGCAQLHLDQSFEKCLRESYLEDFGAEIKLLDKTPIAVYEFKKSGITVPGLIFATLIETSEEHIKKQFNTHKHDEVKFLSLKEIETEVSADESVENFHENAKNALGLKKEKDT